MPTTSSFAVDATAIELLNRVSILAAGSARKNVDPVTSCVKVYSFLVVISWMYLGELGVDRGLTV